ncbi:hypothetical protein JW777_04270 [bacterium]|nr:hypothetical protein [bacterium]
MNRRARSAAVLSLMIPAALSAGWWDWKTHTATLEIRDLCPAGGRLWCATEGGLLAFDPAAGSFQSWTNTEGLAANEMTAVTADRSGTLWLGFANGLLQRWNPADNTRRTVDDYQGRSVTSLWSEGDSLYVGLDIGVSLFLVPRNEVRETYRRLGQGIQVETPVNAVAVREGRIWAATDEGAAWAPLNGANLLDPESWSNPVLPAPQDAVSCLTEWDGKTALLGPSGLFLQNAEGWEWMADGYPGTRPEAAVRYGDWLYAATAAGIFRWAGSAWEPVWASVTGGLSFGVFLDRLWIGTREGLREAAAAALEPGRHLPECPVANLMTDMACDPAGKLWCATPKGICRLDADGWKRFSFTERPELAVSDARAVATDGPGRAWFGTWGNGLFRVEGDSLAGVYDVRNGILATSDEKDPDYPCVSDLAFDRNGVLWALNWNAQTNRPLTALDPDSGWSYFGISQGVTAQELQGLSVGPDNRKWIGTAQSGGVLILDDAGTVSNPDDDPSVEWIGMSDGLSTNAITAVAVDRDGVAWIGTRDGLFYYSYGTVGQIHRYYQDIITALLVDGVNNVWVGTTIGAGYFSASTYEGGHFTAAASPLPSDRVTSLAWDPESGRVFIGTNRGLSSVATPFSRPAEKLGSLSVHPNPFFPDRQEAVVIEGLSGSVSVSVFTAAGRLVRRFPTGTGYGRRILWDGRNDQGTAVAGGVYLIVAQEEGGRTAAAKTAVIR